MVFDCCDWKNNPSFKADQPKDDSIFYFVQIVLCIHYILTGQNNLAIKWC